MNSFGYIDMREWGVGDRFTQNQAEAATRDGNIIVSAGAGSGKTTVMIARIINKLLNGARLDRMLIVTFTRAAAADMRIKLSEKLSELKRASENKNAKVYASICDATDAMSVCDIGTLHGYCQKLIRRYYGAAGIDPAATLCEDGEISLIERDAVETAVADRLKSGDKYFAAVYDMLSTRRSAENVVSTVTDIVEFALSNAEPDKYLVESVPDEQAFSTLDGIVAARRAALAERIAELKKDLIAVGMDKHATVIDELADYADGVIDKPTATSHSARGDATDLLNERFKALRADCKKLRELKAEYESIKTVEGKPYVDALLAVARAALEKFDAGKKSRNKIGYSDLEHGAFRVLGDDACMREIRQTVDHVFIDEFQDVNPLQFEFAKKFRDAGAEMFVVGDVKQSIYGFRRCSPEHFINEIKGAIPIEAVREYERAGAKYKGCRRFVHIPLTDNFRSSRAVVDFVNGIFDNTMTEDFGGADYKNKDRLVCGAPDVCGALPSGARAELVTVDMPETEPERADGGYSVVDAATRERAPEPEAAFIADAVERWIRFVTLKTEYENKLARARGEKEKLPPELGEIAVLLRSANAAFCSALAREFDKRGIRYNFGRKSSVKSYASAVALTDMLRCVDNRFDDVALYTALRSSMGMFSDEQLAELAADGGAACAADGVLPDCGKSYAFWQKVDAYTGKYREKLDGFFALRDDIAAYSKIHDCGDTLGYITSLTDYFQHVYETGGDARAAEALIEYATERRCDIHAFLNYYDSADFDLALESGSDAVNITTVHSSKGLEYDFVIVADTAREFNKSDLSARVLVSESGVAVKVPDAGARTLVKTARWAEQNAVAPDKLKQEELRLFYVALTRAKKKLIVCGKNKSRGTDELSPEKAKRPLDFARLGAAGVSSARALDEITADADVYARLLGEKDGADVLAEAPHGVVREIADAVRERCSEEYTGRADIPVKACVTSVAHELALADVYDYTSSARIVTDDHDGDDGVDARLRGTAYHRAMELIDLDDPRADAVTDKCEHIELVDIDKVLRAAKAMKKLKTDKVFVGDVRCFKERYFIVDMPAVDIGVDAPDNVLVQGVIDLLLVDTHGNAIVVDYKTGDPKRLANEGYKTQLRLYARAVEKATRGKYSVKKTFLYSFASGELVAVDVL